LSKNLIGLTVITFLLPLAFTAVTNGKIVTKNVEYKDGNTVFEGYFAYDDSFKGKMPGVVIFHEWWGVNPYVKGRAEQIAGLGYAAFCADIYGKGVKPQNMDEAGKQAGIYRGDIALMRRRAELGLEELKKQPVVDTTRTAAMGYCFGGGVALELARSGADILGAACFHGNLDTPNPEDAKNIKAKIIVLQGADDSYTKPAVPALEKELSGAKVDWQMIEYSGAVHGFTNLANGNDNAKGVAYNEKADKRSWEAMKSFFKEIFAEK
jgi:dienelactone hydrolase